MTRSSRCGKFALRCSLEILSRFSRLSSFPPFTHYLFFYLLSSSLSAHWVRARSLAEYVYGSFDRRAIRSPAGGYRGSDWRTGGVFISSPRNSSGRKRDSLSLSRECRYYYLWANGKTRWVIDHMDNPPVPSSRRDVNHSWILLTVLCRGDNTPIALSFRRIDHPASLRRSSRSAHRISELFGTHRYNNDPASLPPCFLLLLRLPFLVSATPNCTPVCHHLYYIALQSVATIWMELDVYRESLPYKSLFNSDSSNPQFCTVALYIIYILDA